jgi:hypothetical protein
MTLQATRRPGHPSFPTLWAALSALTATLAAYAVENPAVHRLGDHPAVVVQRLQRTAGYDYASKFYPHPAHLYLLPASPDELERTRTAAQAAVIDPWPDVADEPSGPLAQR